VNENNLEANINHPDKRVHLAPSAMLDEMRRAIKTVPAHDPAYPFILGAGLRTRWTANTIHRDPAWRKGQGPHCALHLAPSDAQRLGVINGDAVRVSTRRGALTLPAQIDPKLVDGYVWMPNGFGHVSNDSNGKLQPVGGNHNELTDVADRDPFTGIPHHRYVQCRVEPA
jgi:formate dehydrogenase